MKEYRISRGWRFFIYVTLPLLIAPFFIILLLPFIPSMNEDLNPESYWLLLPMSLGMITILILGLIDTIQGKFVIDRDKIYVVSVFSKRQLLFDEIKGYRLNGNHIFIESKNEKKKRVKINTYLEKVNEIMDWLSEHYLDLDLAEANQEADEIFNNAEFGWSIDQREEKLKLAHRTAKIVNWTGVIIGIWTLFMPIPYEFAIIASIVFPLFCLIVLKYFNGLIRLEQKKYATYPTIFWAFFTPSVGLFFRGFADFHIFDFTEIWTPFTFIALTFFTALILINKDFDVNKLKSYASSLILLMFVLCYSYGSIITLNCLYDNSTPEMYSTTILSKRETSGKSTTYYLELAPWANQKENIEISVSKDLYINFDQNEKVNILLMQGRFDIPWFEIVD